MNEKIKNYLGIAGTTTLIMLTLLLIVATYATYTFSRGVDPSQYRSFSVSAEGEVKTTPDVAQFSFTVITEGGIDVEKLQGENSEKANKMIRLIKDAGVSDEDIQARKYIA